MTICVTVRLALSCEIPGVILQFDSEAEQFFSLLLDNIHDF